MNQNNIAMEAKLINMADFVYAGEGANGESYNHKEDSNLMLKLYFPTFDPELVKLEMQRALDVYEAGIPSPKPGELVTDGKGRYGLLFRRLVGKVSYARAVGNNPENVEALARDFARLGLKFHSTEVDTSKFPSVKQQYLDMVETSVYCTPQEKEKLLAIINAAPDATTAIHGDFHFGNALIMGDERFYIDLGEFAYGHPYFDLGMMVLCTAWNSDDFIVPSFHMTKAQAVKFLKYFLDEYFGGRYTFEQAMQLLEPYAAVKGVFVERNGNFHFDPMHDYLARN